MKTSRLNKLLVIITSAIVLGILVGAGGSLIYHHVFAGNRSEDVQNSSDYASSATSNPQAPSKQVRQHLSRGDAWGDVYLTKGNLQWVVRNLDKTAMRSISADVKVKLVSDTETFKIAYNSPRLYDETHKELEAFLVNCYQHSDYNLITPNYQIKYVKS